MSKFKLTRNLFFGGVFLAAIIVLLVLFGGGLFSIFTGTVNGFAYVGANIEGTDRPFQDETIVYEFTLSSIEPAFSLSNNFRFGVSVNPSFENLQVYGWFLDGELIEMVPTRTFGSKNPMIREIWGESIVEQGLAAWCRTTTKEFCSISPTTFSTFNSLSYNLNIPIKSIEALLGDGTPRYLPHEKTIDFSSISPGNHVLELKSLRINSTRCGLLRDNVEYLNFKSEECPAYIEGGDGFIMSSSYITGSKNFSWFRQATAQDFDRVAIDKESVDVSSYFVFTRTYDETVEYFSPRFITIASKNITVLAIDIPSVCGDNVCEGDETPVTCPVDCETVTPPVCGNNVCETGETVLNCPVDCEIIVPPVCGDNVCEEGETVLNCPVDCGVEPPIEPPSELSLLTIIAISIFGISILLLIWNFFFRR